MYPALLLFNFSTIFCYFLTVFNVRFASPSVYKFIDGRTAPPSFNNTRTHCQKKTTDLGVARDGDVDELERGIGVAKGDDGNVDASGLGDGLMIRPRIRNHQQSRLLERTLNLIREGP